MRCLEVVVVFLWLSSHILILQARNTPTQGNSYIETWPNDATITDNDITDASQTTDEEKGGLLYDIFGIQRPKVLESAIDKSPPPTEKEEERGWTYGGYDKNQHHHKESHQYSSYGDEQFKKYHGFIGDAARAGYGGKFKLLSKKKKKDPLSKIVFEDTGRLMDENDDPVDGTQFKLDFTSLDDCKRACGELPTCFAGTWNPDTNECFFHSGDYVCNDLDGAGPYMTFRKIVCESDIADEVGGLVEAHVRVGRSFPAGIPVKADNHLECLQACAEANMGDFIEGFSSTLDEFEIMESKMICFGFDYDFAKHKCFLHLRTHYWQPFFGDFGDATPICSSTEIGSLDGGLDDDEAFKEKQSVVNVLWCPAMPDP